MRNKIFIIFAALALALSLTGCSNESASERAEKYASPKVSAAVEALTAVRRDELSPVTYGFDEQYAYTGVTQAQLELFSAEASDYSEPDSEFFSLVCDMAIDGMPEGLSAYDQYRYLAFFVSACTEYDLRGRAGLMSVTPYGAVTRGLSICQGYADFYLYLCQQADLWCRYVAGASTTGEHGWNLVKLEDGTYYVDVTWCDQLGEIGNSSWQSYFMLTEEQLLRDHEVFDGGPATGETVFDA